MILLTISGRGLQCWQVGEVVIVDFNQVLRPLFEAWKSGFHHTVDVSEPGRSVCVDQILQAFNPHGLPSFHIRQLRQPPMSALDELLLGDHKPFDSIAVVALLLVALEKESAPHHRQGCQRILPKLWLAEGCSLLTRKIVSSSHSPSLKTSCFVIGCVFAVDTEKELPVAFVRVGLSVPTCCLMLLYWVVVPC